MMKMKRSRKVLAGMVLVAGLLLTGCGKEDFGVAEITCNDGTSIVGSGYRTSHLAVVNTCKLPKAETATVHFWCSECKYDETLELVAPAAKLFKCECKKDEASHYSIVVGNAELPSEE